MATTYKRLGAIQSGGVIGTADTLYTASSGVIVSTIVVCNTAASAATYRIGISTTTSFATAGYIVYGTSVPANDSIFLNVALTLDATNKYLLCSASVNTVSFTACGAEIT